MVDAKFVNVIVEENSQEYILFTLVSCCWHENDHTLMSITPCWYSERKACQTNGEMVVQDPGEICMTSRHQVVILLFLFKIIHMDPFLSLSFSYAY